MTEQHFVNASDLPADVPLDAAQTEMGGIWQSGPGPSPVKEVVPVDSMVQSGLKPTAAQMAEVPVAPGEVTLSPVNSFAKSDMGGAVQGPPDLTGVAPVTDTLASGAINETGKEVTAGAVQEGLGAVGKEGIANVGKSTVVEAGKNAVAAETGKAVAGETTKAIGSTVAGETTKAITNEVGKNITSSAAQNLASTAAANGVKSVATSATASVASGAASMGAGIAGGLAGGAIGEAIGGKTGGKVGSALGSALAAGMMLGPWGAVAALAISGIMELF